MSYSRETPDKILRNKEIILTKSDIEKFVEFSEEFGEFCARWKTSNKTISTSQIRGIYEKVRRF